MNLRLRICEATKEDEAGLVALLNCAFSGFTTPGIYNAEDATGGWTNEIHMFQGPRARLERDSDELPLLRNSEDNGTYLKAVEEETGKILGCIKIEVKEDQVAYIGMFSVLPAYQSKGIGSKLLGEAEALAERENAKKVTLTTVNVRNTLINYYQKRGYHDTGKRPPYAYRSTDVSTMPLEFIILDKFMVVK